MRAFTVGREAQLKELERSLDQNDAEVGAALLVKANYGGGKSHLLKIVREIALQSGYAVSLVIVNSQEGVRFNRMDTILGAICRELEIGGQNQKGAGALFDAFCGVSSELPQDIQRIRERISRICFDFFDGDLFPGMSYFAVTPDFVAKCKSELLSRGVYDFDYTRFEQLPSFEMDAIQLPQFLELSVRIRKIYGQAYEVDLLGLLSDAELKRAVERVWNVRSPDRVRRSIQAVVKALDDRLETVMS